MLLPGSINTLDIWNIIRNSKPPYGDPKTRKGVTFTRMSMFKVSYAIVLREQNEQPHVILTTEKDGESFNTYTQKILLTKTECNFGGHRYWFKCPGCRKRIGTLHSTSFRWSCMKCSSTGYLSKQLTPKLRSEYLIKTQIFPIMIYRKAKNIKRVTWQKKLTKKVNTFKGYCESLGYDYRAFLPRTSRPYLDFNSSLEAQLAVYERMSSFT